MYRVGVNSSNLASVGYEPASRVLEIEFRKGGIYQYFNVSPAVYQQLMGASSLGRYHARFIKWCYRYLRIA